MTNSPSSSQSIEGGTAGAEIKILFVNLQISFRKALGGRSFIRILVTSNLRPYYEGDLTLPSLNLDWEEPFPQRCC